MGRELKRKEAKKNKNRNIKTEAELDSGIKVSTLLKIVAFLALMLLVLYYVIAVFVTKEIDISWSDNNTNEIDSNSVSNKILAQNIFNQKEETYYVYFYDFSDEDVNISTAVNNSGLTVYRVDTSSGLNKNYVTEENGNRNVTSIDDLKVKNPTIIKVSNDKVTAYYEGKVEIISSLG